ncbi:MAG: GNAT family N-acetyltransferase [Anaerolineales bacterium]
MIDQKFTLRALQPSDSPALINLITEFDGDLTTRFQVDPYEAIISGTEFRTEGLVVECDGIDGLVGMGTVRFGKVQYSGKVLPFAFLDGLKVHKDFRGNGLGHEIANWRVQRAREAYGDQCVIATGMLYDNYASHAVAAKWCREFLESAINVFIMPTRSHPPKSPTGIKVREIEAHEYEEFAVRQNEFYKNYNLYAPSDANSIRNALGVAVDGKKPYRFFAAIDKNGNLVGGAQTWARGILKSDKINDPPQPIRMMNHLLHLFPSDFIIRDINVSGLWHQPGQLNAARFLWEAIRWECKDQGNMITTGFDPRDPVRQAVTLKPWHQPRPLITLALQSPTLINRDNLLFTLGRV